MPFPYIFTFYSYKGGVGRSMALLNVAYTLVSRGRHVLILDLDLEAPGVSGFMHRNGELDKPIGAHPKDVLSLLYLAMETVRTGQHADHVPPVSNFLRSVRSDKLATLEPKFGKVGRLDVIGADQELNYFDRLAELQFKDLTQEELKTLSRLLHTYFKQQRFPFRPLGVEDSDPPISTPYDYILVDSRTGITEFGGLCVGPLADRLVVLTGLNDQNVIGTRDFLEVAGIQPQERPATAELWDDADPAPDTEAPSLGPKPTIVVASPVPAGEILYKRERMKELQKVLGLEPLSLSYHPQMALMESIFVRDYREEYLTSEYAKLTNRVMEQVGDEPQQIFPLLTKLYPIGIELPLVRESRGISEILERALRAAAADNEVGAALLATIAEHANVSTPESELNRLFVTMARHPSFRPTVFFNWGAFLYLKAKDNTGSEADRLLSEADKKLSESARLNPASPDCFNIWGVVIAAQAKTRIGTEAELLFAEAMNKFREATRLNPDFPDYFNNWGVVLSNQAESKTGPEADILFTDAVQKHTEAFRLKPDAPDYLNSWGNTLSKQAKIKKGPEADRLFTEAGEKYNESLRLKPGNPHVLLNWGAALEVQASTKRGPEADTLYEQAHTKLRDAERIQPGLASFKLACIEGILGNATASIEHLRRASNLTQKRINEESDFDPIRSDPTFREFVESLPKE